jgi:hypothetical protein
MLLEDIMKYYEYLVLIIIIGIIIVTFYNARTLRRISKYFSSQQFQITSMYEIDPVSLQEHFVVGVFNNNINDSRIVSLGIAYKNRNIDYFSTYLKQEDLGMNSKIVIPSRDSIKLQINCNEIKTIIRDFNQGSGKTDRVSIYVIDSLGITTTSKSKSIRTMLKKMIKQDIKKEKEEKKKKQAFLDKEKKEKREEERLIKRNIRKEKRNNVFLKLKAKIKRRKI